MSAQIRLEGEPPRRLTEGHYIIGRGEDCDILMPEDDAGASRRHAFMEQDEAGNWSIADLKSRNGTSVNGRRIERRQQLRDGDVITIGRSQLTMAIPRAQPTIQAPPAVEAIANAPVSPPLPPSPASDISPRPNPVQPTPIVNPAPVPPPPPVEKWSPRERTTPQESPDARIEPAVVEGPVPPQKWAPQERWTPQEPSAPVQPMVAPPPAVPSPPPYEDQNAPPGVDAAFLENLIRNAQCQHCGTRYADSLQRCPACGRSPRKAPPTGPSPGVPQEAAPGPYETPAGYGPPQPISPPAWPSANPMNPPQPAASPPPVAQAAGGDQARGGTTAIPRPQPSANDPILRAASLTAGFLMLASLFMPWAQVQVLFVSMGGSYVQLCQLVLRAVSQAPGAIGQEPRMLLVFLPALAALVTLSSIAGWTAPKIQAALLLVGGALGLLASGAVYYYLTNNTLINFFGILGMGFNIFAFISLVAAAVGIWKLGTLGEKRP